MATEIDGDPAIWTVGAPGGFPRWAVLPTTNVVTFKLIDNLNVDNAVVHNTFFVMKLPFAGFPPNVLGQSKPIDIHFLP